MSLRDIFEPLWERREFGSKLVNYLQRFAGFVLFITRAALIQMLQPDELVRNEPPANWSQSNCVWAVFHLQPEGSLGHWSGREAHRENLRARTLPLLCGSKTERSLKMKM